MNRKQKLELTWIGKEDRPKLEPRILIEEPERSYHAAHRVTDRDLFDNRLISGDNLLALKALEQEFTGKVKCVYIDPPFNTQQTFEHYDDGLEHSLWLQMMHQRLMLLHRLLSLDGSLFIHIDDNELAYLVAIADEVFGRSNRIAVVTFKQSAASGPKSVNPGLVSTSNFLLYYVKDKAHWKPNRVYVPIARDARYNNVILNMDAHHSEWELGTLRDAFAQSLGIEPSSIDSKLGPKREKRLTQFVLRNRHRVVQPALVRPADINAAAREALSASAEQPGRVFN